jgi:hypothetical protein
VLTRSAIDRAAPCSAPARNGPLNTTMAVGPSASLPRTFCLVSGSNAAPSRKPSTKALTLAAAGMNRAARNPGGSSSIASS